MIHSHAAVRARQVETTRTRRRCINRTCGRYRNKVDHPRCHSCGRSTKWAPIAFLFIFARTFR